MQTETDRQGDRQADRKIGRQAETDRQMRIKFSL